MTFWMEVIQDSKISKMCKTKSYCTAMIGQKVVSGAPKVPLQHTKFSRSPWLPIALLWSSELSRNKDNWRWTNGPSGIVWFFRHPDLFRHKPFLEVYHFYLLGHVNAGTSDSQEWVRYLLQKTIKYNWREMLQEGASTRRKLSYITCLRQRKMTALACRKVSPEKALGGGQTSPEWAEFSMACALIFSCLVYHRRARLILTAVSGCHLFHK